MEFRLVLFRADRIRVERGLNPHHVLHDFSRHCQILASHEFHSREHGFPLSLSRLEYYVAVVAAARRVYENPPTIIERESAIFRMLHIARSEEHTSELQSLMRISYAVF